MSNYIPGENPAVRRQREAEYVQELRERLENDPAFMRELMLESVFDAADGCRVEPDGRCPHGYSSPLILLGVI